jgi:superfamily I DNA and/or RNA helicase
VLSKKVFDEYLSFSVKLQAKKYQFFEKCFEKMSRRLLMNIYCCFEELTLNRGDILSIQNEYVDRLYLV